MCFVSNAVRLVTNDNLLDVPVPLKRLYAEVSPLGDVKPLINVVPPLFNQFNKSSD